MRSGSATLEQFRHEVRPYSRWFREEKRRPVHCLSAGYTRRLLMLYWAAVFFVIALVAAAFGFGGIAASAVGVSKILFVVFLVFALVSLLVGRRRVL